MAICSMFGHREFYPNSKIEKQIKEKFVYAIENLKITEFYLGGMGQFDFVCANYLQELKQTYPQIKSCLVLAYLDKNVTDYDREYRQKMYDEIIFPPLENVSPKWAISHRNRWIADKSEYIIFYVNHSWGGAAKALEYASRAHKTFVNLGDKK